MKIEATNEEIRELFKDILLQGFLELLDENKNGISEYIFSEIAEQFILEEKHKDILSKAFEAAIRKTVINKVER